MLANLIDAGIRGGPVFNAGDEVGHRVWQPLDFQIDLAGWKVLDKATDAVLLGEAVAAPPKTDSLNLAADGKLIVDH